MMQSYKGMKNVRVEAVVFDCAHPDQVADFYAKLLGGAVEADPYGGYNVRLPGLGMVLGFQYDPDYQRPAYLGKEAQQPMAHLDIQVCDRTAAVEYALSIGARHPEKQFTVPGSGWVPEWTTLLDPDGHPFFLCDEGCEIA